MLTVAQAPRNKSLRLLPNHKAGSGKQYPSMQTIRAFSRNPDLAAKVKAALPSLVLAVAVTLDQATRGPSITAMLIQNFLI